MTLFPFNRCRIFGHQRTLVGARGHVGALFSGTATALLTRCDRCGQHSTEVYAGAWTIEDFERTDSPTREIAELNRMAGTE